MFLVIVIWLVFVFVIYIIILLLSKWVLIFLVLFGGFIFFVFFNFKLRLLFRLSFWRNIDELFLLISFDYFLGLEVIKLEICFIFFKY